MVQTAVGIDQSLPAFDQLAMARRIHGAELALAAQLANADRRLADAKGEAKATHRLEVTAAEADHREAISQIQLDQLKLRLAAEADEQEG